jgi:HlyD family secretion protein
MAKTLNKRKRKWWLVAALLAVAGGSAGYYTYTKREILVTVQTDRVTRRSLTELVVANGRIHPVVQVKISPEVSGEIIELPVKEGQCVKKGELLMRIKPDFYLANRRSAEASYQASVANRDLASANQRKAEAEELRNAQLYKGQLISESAYQEMLTLRDVARATFQNSEHQVNVAKAALSRADEELAKTTIYSPIAGTVSKLNSQLGERVVGTAMMTGTEVMIVADLNEMEARVDIGEVDVVLIAQGQITRLEVEAFRDRKFNGVVTEIANSSRSLNQPQGQGGGGGGMGGGPQPQEATRFEVKVRIQDKETFRPGMSVTAEIETRTRTNVLSVPILSVTTRPPKEATNAVANGGPSLVSTNRKSTERPKQIEVVFLTEQDKVRAAPVKRGISDDDYTEIIEGLKEGEEVVSGGAKAISRDLEDGKRIKRGQPDKVKAKEEDKK